VERRRVFIFGIHEHHAHAERLAQGDGAVGGVAEQQPTIAFAVCVTAPRRRRVPRDGMP